MTDYARGRADALKEAAEIVINVRLKTYSAAAHVVCDAIHRHIEALAQQPQYNPEMVKKLHKLKDEKPVAYFTDADAFMNYLEGPKRECRQSCSLCGHWHSPGPCPAIGKLLTADGRPLSVAIDEIEALAQQPQTVKEVVGYDRNNQPVFGVKPETKRECGTCEHHKNFAILRYECSEPCLSCFGYDKYEAEAGA